MPLLLLVEDDRDTRSQLADLLSEEGYAVCEAEDREGGLEVLRARKPDLLILDYGLPAQADGADFLRTKAKEPAVASIPVILASGFVLPPEMDGVVATISKPFNVDELLSLVQQFAGPPEKPNASTAG